MKGMPALLFAAADLDKKSSFYIHAAANQFALQKQRGL